MYTVVAAVFDELINDFGNWAIFKSEFFMCVWETLWASESFLIAKFRSILR